MTEVVLYHHVQGLTEGVRSFADELRQAGHTVHTPDLFDGRTFDTIEEGMAFAREAGFGALAERGVAAAEGIRPEVVYAGFSFGVMPAQQLAQTRPGARGAAAHVRVPPGLGVRGRVARGRAGAGARQGGRPVLRRGPRGRAGPRRLGRPGRAVPLPGGGAPLRRLLAARRTTPPPRRCSPSACWRSSTGEGGDQSRSSGRSSSQNSPAARGTACSPVPSRCDSWARSSTRRIFPEIVFGSSANSSRRTRLNGARCERA